MPDRASMTGRVRSGASRARGAGDEALDRLTRSVEAAQDALKDLRKEVSRGTRDVLKDLDTTLKDARRTYAARAGRHQGPPAGPTGADDGQVRSNAPRASASERRCGIKPPKGDYRDRIARRRQAKDDTEASAGEHGARANPGQQGGRGTGRADGGPNRARAAGRLGRGAEDGFRWRGRGPSPAGNGASCRGDRVRHRADRLSRAGTRADGGGDDGSGGRRSVADDLISSGDQQGQVVTLARRPIWSCEPSRNPRCAARRRWG